MTNDKGRRPESPTFVLHFYIRRLLWHHPCKVSPNLVYCLLPMALVASQLALARADARHCTREILLEEA